MRTRLVSEGWTKELRDGSKLGCSEIRIACPFLQTKTIQDLLAEGAAESLRVLTRFNLRDMAEGVSDVDALRALLEHGAEVRGLRGLHTKLYVFGTRRAIVTSANLTRSALSTNHELGIVTGEATLVAACISYFDQLWAQCGPSLDGKRLSDWRSEVIAHRTRVADRAGRLRDFGARVAIHGPQPQIPLSHAVEDTEQAFVKFFGQGTNRATRSFSVLEEVKRAGCHWACTYPRGKRPRAVRDGASMFMGRMVEDPNDILIFGRATGFAHVEGRDDATGEEIEERPWKEHWPHYIRVDNAEFVAGTMSNGISLNSLMHELGANAFLSTQRNLRAGKGNTEPRRSYMRQAAVELSPEGTSWLEARLNEAFLDHGKHLAEELSWLDWPKGAKQSG